MRPHARGLVTRYSGLSDFELSDAFGRLDDSLWSLPPLHLFLKPLRAAFPMQNFSKAHQVLRINELLNFIAADLPSKDQVQMALTCRAIYEPIMDRRWAHIYSVACLIRCLPEDALEETDDEGVVQVCLLDLVGPIKLKIHHGPVKYLRNIGTAPVGTLSTLRPAC